MTLFFPPNIVLKLDDFRLLIVCIFDCSPEEFYCLFTSKLNSEVLEYIFGFFMESVLFQPLQFVFCSFAQYSLICIFVVMIKTRHD